MEKRVDINKKEKVLIIKTGYSEVLDKEEDSRKVSLGDVLRTTTLLNYYKNHDVTWLTDVYALPLLERNPLINRLLTLDFWSSIQLQSEEFDTIVNLEKNRKICEFVRRLDAWKKYGFRFDSKNNRIEAYDRAFEILSVGSDTNVKKENDRYLQSLLFETVGAKWDGEEYTLGYKPKTKEKYDVNLNTQVGPKWPTKAWSKKNWAKLEELLEKDGLKVTRQDKQPTEILTNLNNYIDWINSGKLTVTIDSLGLHLGIVLKKKVIGLFGPTPYKEVYFYGRGKAIFPEPIWGCIPCFERKCKRTRNCMENISVEKVYEETISLLGGVLK